MISAVQKKHAILGLVLVSVIWGLTFPLIRGAMESLDAISFVTFRFGIAAVLMFFWVYWRRSSQMWQIASVKWGLILGSLSGLHYLFQTKGLELIPSGRAAFITGTNVIMVPMIAAILRIYPVKGVDFLAAFLACVGLLLMTEAHFLGLSVGDYWVLACAFDYAIYLLVLSYVLRHQKVDALLLAFWQIVGVLLLSTLVYVWVAPPMLSLTQPVIIALGFCAVFATVGTFSIQTYCQKYISAQKAALIFSLEPVFAAFFGFILLAEILSFWNAVGAFVILIATVLPDVYRVRKKKRLDVS